jgi:hypothetical protein
VLLPDGLAQELAPLDRPDPHTIDAASDATVAGDSGHTSDVEDDTPSSPLKPVRIRFTTKNPVHGFTEGVRRGVENFREFLRRLF